MSRKSERRQERSAEEKRAIDIRRGVLIAHVVLELVLILGVKLGWYSVFFEGKLVAAVDGSTAGSPFVDQARWLILASVVAFFFTSYDLVADADIQWPPLLASAFALGICGQVCWKLDRSFDRIVDQVVAVETLKRLEPGHHDAPPSPDPRGTAAVASATAPGPASIAPATSATASAAGAEREPPVRLKLDLGLKLALFASASMALLSIYLTFFARRET